MTSDQIITKLEQLLMDIRRTLVDVKTIAADDVRDGHVHRAWSDARRALDGVENAVHVLLPQLSSLTRTTPAPIMGWTCGCGWSNGINLATCAMCKRTPDEGFGVLFSSSTEEETIATLRAAIMHVIVTGVPLYTDAAIVGQTFDGAATAISVINHVAEKVTTQQQEIDAAMRVLNPNVPTSGLVDAARQVKQVAIVEAENSLMLEKKLQQQQQEIERLRAVEALSVIS